MSRAALQVAARRIILSLLTISRSVHAATCPPPAVFGHDDLKLGYGPLDTVHEEFLALLDTLLAVPEEEMSRVLESVHLHSREHFAQEERWMRETDFPARDCHAEEHAAVLASLAGVSRRVASGDYAAGRRLARALADWFPGHAIHLDSALAHWMCKKRLGGKPVVLRRSIAGPLAGGPAARNHLEMTK